jgi:hypothetical protein
MNAERRIKWAKGYGRVNFSQWLKLLVMAKLAKILSK